MDDERIMSASPAVAGAASGGSGAFAQAGAAQVEAPDGRRLLFLSTWYFVNSILFISICLGCYATGWEYSTRRYVKGAADAIIPAFAPPEEAIQAILDWMSHGPAQIESGFTGSPSDRDPIDTLNYSELLRVCGTATNAFINLADSDGLAARRLLLLDSRAGAKHVDAEVFVNGRWIVVDPAFRTILRGVDGKTLTRNQLADPAVFVAATKNIPNYDPLYSFERTAHVRAARLGFIGRTVQKILDTLVPDWDASVSLSLVLERKSLTAMIGAIAIVLFLGLLRFALRRYAEQRLHIHPVRLRHRLRGAYQAFLHTAS